MIRLTWPNGIPHVLSAPTERMQLPQSKRDGWQCMCSGMRPATPEEIEQWRGEGRAG